MGRGVARAATAAVGWRKDGQWVIALGAAGSVEGAAVHFDTPFDLASVTKPAFALTCAKLVDEGALSWQDPLAKYLPELSASAGGDASVASHLSHRAGLCAHRELFAPLREGYPFDRRSALREAARAVRVGASREAALYSDLGYILVGEAVSRRSGRPLDEVIAQRLGPLVGPELGSSRQWQRRAPAFAALVAPTEVVPWRGGLLRGVVHDDNAWALTGHGCSGHAGLFGTAKAVLELGMLAVDSLAGRGPLPKASVLELVRARPGGSLRMGFDSKSGPESMAGRVAGPNTFGHLGFSGTSLWCDPNLEAVTVLLTNRVYPTQQNRAIRQARPAVHDALFSLAMAQGATPSNDASPSNGASQREGYDEA